MRKIAGIVLTFLVGLGLLGGGFVLLTATEVKCGSEVMQPGDLCDTTNRGVTTTRTYDEQAKANNLYGYGALAVGVLMLGYGGWGVRKLAKERQAAAAAVPVLPPTPAVPAAPSA